MNYIFSLGFTRITDYWLLEEVEIEGAKDEKDPKDLKALRLQRTVVA
jgi:hypothetical protein